MKKWIKENKVTILLLIITFLIMLYIGYNMYLEIESVPKEDIDYVLNFSSPNIYTIITLLIVVVIVSFIFVDPLKLFKNTELG